METIRSLLQRAVLPRAMVDDFLDPRAPVWARFDPELGYTLRTAFIKDGVDGAYTIARYADTGERWLVNFADHPCRINTYGDSFTQCHQVSDGETWQEVLASHFGEPIRNFGIGGFGVYQAYRRMLRVESSERGTPYVILNIWGDDHHRSLMSYRWLTFMDHWKGGQRATMFHGNPWSHVRLDLQTGELVERPNPFPTPESLYLLCDEEAVYEAFKDDLWVHMIVAARGDGEVDVAPLEGTAEALGLNLDFRSPESRPASAQFLYNEYAWRCSMQIVSRAQAFADRHGKQLLVLLSYPDVGVIGVCRGLERGDPAYMDWHPRHFRDFMAQQGIRFFDALPAHLAEFETFRLSPEEYARRYYIGHYNPRGNHFFAYAIKDAMLDWLEPKPVTYQQGEDLIRFRGYLPG